MPANRKDADAQEAIVEVSRSVYTAVGMAISNVSMITGRDGVIIVDTGVGARESEAIAAAFRAICPKPVAAVIYTHGHPDHIGGAPAFTGGDPAIPVWARANFGAEDKGMPGLEAINALRGVRQFGFKLPMEKKRASSMLPARFSSPASLSPGTPPNRTFAEEEKELAIAGVRLVLRAAPGETADHLCVWLPDEEVLFTGDNLYRSFPNLAPVRGTPYRDITRWADSLDVLLSFNAAAAVTGHNMPVLGREEVRETLTAYRDAIRWVYEKTLEAVNKGLGPDDFREAVRLPPHLADKAFLAEWYGGVEWSARAVFAGLLGWFDGNPANLSPLAPKEEAERMASLAGGREALLAAAEQAVLGSDWRWAAKLADCLLRLEHEPRRAMLVKIRALEEIAAELSPIGGYNYLMSCVEELRAGLAE